MRYRVRAYCHQWACPCNVHDGEVGQVVPASDYRVSAGYIRLRFGDGREAEFTRDELEEVVEQEGARHAAVP